MAVTHVSHDLTALTDGPEQTTPHVHVYTRKGRWYVRPVEKDYDFKVIRFRQGDVIAPHRHLGGPIYKVLLWGLIRYQEDEVLQPGCIACVDAGVEYRGEVVQDSMLILLEPRESRIVET